MPLAYLGLGTNLGNKAANLDLAIQALDMQAGKVCAVSGYYQSAPVEFDSDNDFLNAVLLLETELSPLKLLHITQLIEKELGRTQKSVDGIYSDRTMDIDLLLYDNLVIDLPELKIPHPKMTERDFVLIPLTEIAPDLIHPATGVRFSEMR